MFCPLPENVPSQKKEVGGLRSSAKMLAMSDANIDIYTDAKVPVPTKERKTVWAYSIDFAGYSPCLFDEC